jgi:light-regulated signal transduction histidine kinase (bacteriophytochrome)
MAAIATKSTTDFVKISFSDNGIGFNQAYADKVFSIFQRLHSADKYSGTGIGLALCKKIVENHGGYIFADSQVGEGTTFHIYLPIQEIIARPESPEVQQLNSAV